MKGKFFIFIAIILGVIMLDYSKSYPSLISSTTDNEQIFRQWLRDTLKVLNHSHVKLEDGLVKSEFKVSKDSLSLEILDTYKTVLPLIKHSSFRISDVIGLLKTYDELPKSKSVLNFTISNYYSPSEIAKKYAKLFEIKSLSISNKSSETTYDYLRGRLTGKSQTALNGPQKNKRLVYEFIWKRNVMEKKLIH